MGTTTNEISRDFKRWIIHHSDPDSNAEGVPLRETLWSRAIERAIDHGVLLVIHDRLQRAGIPIAQGSLATVAGYVLWQTWQMHMHKRFLIHLCRQSRNLRDFVVLKGLGLATQIYTHPYQRPTGDLDILIHREDLCFWRCLLNEIGFACESRDKEAWSFDNRTRLKLVNRDGGPFEHTVRLELHCELLNDRKTYLWPTALEQAWGSREYVSLDGEPIPVVGLPVLLPYLCFHQLLHRHNRLIWVLDVVRVVRKHAQDVFDRESLAVISGNPAVRACVYYGLHYAQTLFGVAELVEVMRELRPLKSSLHRYVPLLHGKEFIDNTAPWASAKTAMFREIIKRGN